MTGNFDQLGEVGDGSGRNYEKRGDEQSAAADFRRALAKDPEHQESKDALGRLDADP